MAAEVYSRHTFGHSPSHSSLMPEHFDSPPTHEPLITNQQVLLSSILRELQIANALNQKLAASPPNKYDLLWTLLLQTFAVTTGIIFGVFAILAWVASSRSNRLSSESLSAARNANSLASRANEMGSTANEFGSTANSLAHHANLLRRVRTR